MINAGELNKKITIEYQSKTLNDCGFEAITWTVLASVWSKITPLSGREFFAAQQAQSEASVKILTRYRSGIDTTMRFKFGNKYYYILSIQNVDEANKELVFLCKEAKDSLI
jgi:SPP1 family predicted phage head-tail adaptor